MDKTIIILQITFSPVTNIQIVNNQKDHIILPLFVDHMNSLKISKNT